MFSLYVCALSPLLYGRVMLLVVSLCVLIATRWMGWVVVLLLLVVVFFLKQGKW
jgi:hypothetical protein